MIRIFLTGDNHIGLKYASHERASVLSSARLTAFEGMVSAANEAGCGLFVIAGDLFENTYGVPKRDVKSLVGMLEGFRGTVAVLPGNHDYYDSDVKVWQYFEDCAGSADNIVLMKEYRPYRLSLGEDEAVLYPAMCTSMHSAPGENNLGWIKRAEIDGGCFNIGIAHGALEGETIDTEGQYFLMTRRELEDIPLDLWLLGHTHVPFPELGTEFAASGRIFNAGTHVQTDVACNCAGQCFIIELADDKSVRAKRIDSGTLRFCRKYIRLSPGNMRSQLERELSALGDGSVVDLVLSGAVTDEEYAGRAERLDGMLGRFIEGTYNDSALSRLISPELIDSEFAETSFAAHFLKALLDEPKEAQLAYELLKSLEEGKR